MNKEKRNKPRYNQQFKTFNSEQSCIDIFSRVETLFLEKFFKYNLTDYFSETLTNIEEDLFIKKIKNKQIKQLASETFLTKTPIDVQNFTNNLNQFYSYHPPHEQPEFPHNFKFLYGNSGEVDVAGIEEGELVMVHVKIRAEIQKIERLPDEICKWLQMCQKQAQMLLQRQQQQFFHYLKKYKKKVINIFVVYFGDINFQIFNKQKYETTTIDFFNNQVQVKYHVFYVSRLSLIQKFKKINKIENIEYINDLLIQHYDFKREKHRNKRMKNNKQKVVKTNQDHNKWLRIFYIFKWVSIFSITTLTIGIIFLKFYF